MPLAELNRDRWPNSPKPTARVKIRANKWWRPFKRSDEFDPEKHSPFYVEELPWTRWVAEDSLPEKDCRIVRLLEAGLTQ